MTKAILVKDSIDLGIVICDADASMAFYRDTLGFIFEGEMPMPGGGTMYRLLAGTTLLKLVKPIINPAKAAGGGITGASGYRYFTFTVSNLEEITAACGTAGYAVVVPPREIRPGITISIVEDPDGNWVEFLQHG